MPNFYRIYEEEGERWNGERIKQGAKTGAKTGGGIGAGLGGALGGLGAAAAYRKRKTLGLSKKKALGLGALNVAGGAGLFGGAGAIDGAVIGGGIGALKRGKKKQEESVMEGLEYGDVIQYDDGSRYAFLGEALEETDDDQVAVDEYGNRWLYMGVFTEDGEEIVEDEYALTEEQIEQRANIIANAFEEDEDGNVYLVLNPSLTSDDIIEAEDGHVFIRVAGAPLEEMRVIGKDTIRHTAQDAGSWAKEGAGRAGSWAKNNKGKIAGGAAIGVAGAAGTASGIKASRKRDESEPDEGYGIEEAVREAVTPLINEIVTLREEMDANIHSPYLRNAVSNAVRSTAPAQGNTMALMEELAAAFTDNPDVARELSVGIGSILESDRQERPQSDDWGTPPAPRTGWVMNTPQESAPDPSNVGRQMGHWANPGASELQESAESSPLEGFGAIASLDRRIFGG